jgi:hypothetical protein
MMKENKPGDHAHGGPNGDKLHPVNRPYWKRAHQDWRLWIAAFFIFVAMVIYVLTDNLSLLPRNQSSPQASTPAGVGRSP